MLSNSFTFNKSYETSALCTTCEHREVCKLREEYMKILTTITQPTDCPFTVELKCPYHCVTYYQQSPNWTPGLTPGLQDVYYTNGTNEVPR